MPKVHEWAHGISQLSHNIREANDLDISYDNDMHATQQACWTLSVPAGLIQRNGDARSGQVARAARGGRHGSVGILHLHYNPIITFY